jgi:putative ABC transport system substrate-binding protein
LDLRLEGIEFRDLPYDYDGAFAKQNAGVPRALIVAAGVQFFKDRQHIAELAAKHRMISVFWERELADAGGLISYGPSTAALYRRAADYIDRIARGAKPADLPIEQPTKFELVLNLKTAKAIGLAIPPMLLARADAVIE